MTHDETLWWPQYLTLTWPFPTRKSSQVETLTHQKWSLGNGRSGDGPSQADIFANGLGIKLPKRQLVADLLMVFVGQSMEGNYQPQLVLALLDGFFFPWVSMILRKLKIIEAVCKPSALGKVGEVWSHSNAKPGVVPRLWTRWAMWSVVASLPQVPATFNNSNIGNRNCMDPMEQKDTKRGGYFSN